jgi:hypothetical protein
MEQEAVAIGHDVQVVDPDVRGYVYSLVTAVSVLVPGDRSGHAPTNTRG